MRIHRFHSIGRPHAHGGLLPILALVLLGCSHQAEVATLPDPGAPAAAAAVEPGGAEAGEAASEAGPAQPPAEAPAGPEGSEASVADDELFEEIQPPGGEWLLDDEGREYYIHEVPRVEGGYLWANEEHTRVQLQFGLYFDVVDYDDKVFQVKIYRAVPRWKRSRESEAPDPAVVARVEASYRPEIEDSDRFRFEPFAQGLPNRGQWRQGFDVADLNGDGHLDVVHGPPRKSGGQPTVFLGDGRGGWRRWSEAHFPAILYDYGDVAVGDFNGDGHADLVLGMHLLGLEALIGDGAGHFTRWSEGLPLVQEAGAATFSSRAVDVVDWDGDGRPDIVALGEGPRSRGRVAEGGKLLEPAKGAQVFLNQGDGTWKPDSAGVDEKARDRTFGDALVLGDFNADGRTDFATSSNTRGWRRILYLGAQGGGWNQTEIDTLRPRLFVGAVAAGDLDGNGSDDLVVAYSNREAGTMRSGLDVLYSEGEGWRRRPLVTRENERLLITALDLGDLDGDGALDLVALTKSGEVWIFAGDGQGFFTRERTPNLTEPQEGCRGTHVRLVDLDGDGGDEILAAFAGETQGIPGISANMGCAGQGSLHAWKASVAPADRSQENP